MIECAAAADVGCRLDGGGECHIAGQTEDEVDAFFYAPRHQLRAAVMPVAAIVIRVAGECRRMRRTSGRRWPRMVLLGIGEPERVAYGAADIERIDIYRTRRAAAPVFVFIHGGAWRSGRSKDFAASAEMFLAAGAHYAVPDFAWVQDVGGARRDEEAINPDGTRLRA